MEEFGKGALLVGGVSVGLLILKRLLTRNAIYKSHLMMAGKTCIVTGASDGIGKAIALDLARRNARVILACRDMDKAEAAIKDIRRKTKNGVLVARCLDLSSMNSIHAFCNKTLQSEKRIDILINNAGVFQCPYSKTADGFEMHMAVNHIGHFLLTHLLLDMIEISAPSRIIVVSSSLHKRGKIDFDDFHKEKEYSRRKGYSDSKLANALFARELSERIKGSGINVYCVHPGMVVTNLGRYVVPRIVKLFSWILFPLARLFLKTSMEGAQTVVYCAVEPDLDNETGCYYGDFHKQEWSEAASDLDAAKKLWDVSAELTGENSLATQNFRNQSKWQMLHIKK